MDEVRTGSRNSDGTGHSVQKVKSFAEKIAENVGKVIVGKRSTVELLLVALLCDGHVLLEDVPGVGKTMIARALALSMGVTFKRLQCTPDLLPNDVTGVSIFNQATRGFEFREGPVFSQILLADEINRATPRTQSALLEAMGERQVTVDGMTHLLQRPFFVMATQNPVEFEGTFPLPEAQLDRFLFKLGLGYLDQQTESQMLINLGRAHPIDTLQPVAQAGEIIAMQQAIWDINVDDTVRDYIVRLVQATRSHADLALGASPRGSLSLYRASQALAAVQGRTFVTPDDVKKLAPLTLAHRLLIQPETALRGQSASLILNTLLEQVPLDLGTV